MQAASATAAAARLACAELASADRRKAGSRESAGQRLLVQEHQRAALSGAQLGQIAESRTLTGKDAGHLLSSITASRDLRTDTHIE